MKPFQTRWLMLLNVLLVALLAGCSKAPPPKNEADASSISGYNYSSEGIQEFYVNGAWGGGVSIGGGYGTVCCVMLPDKWTPGLKATVEWTRSDCGERGPNNTRCPPLPDGFQAGQTPPEWEYKTLKKEIPIEPFEKRNTLQVFFYPNDEIKIYVTPFDPEHPDHPAHLGRPHPLDNPNWKDTE